MSGGLVHGGVVPGSHGKHVAVSNQLGVENEIILTFIAFLHVFELPIAPLFFLLRRVYVCSGDAATTVALRKAASHRCRGVAAGVDGQKTLTM